MIILATIFWVIVLTAILAYFTKGHPINFPSSQDVYTPTAVQQTSLPYIMKWPLMHEYEKRCYNWLLRILPENYIVLPQVVLANIVKCNLRPYTANYWKYRSKINKKTIDFVVFNKETFTPVLGVEYDWHTHKYRKTKERDKFVDEVLSTINIPIVHIIHDHSTNHDAYKNEILGYLKY